MWDGNSAPPRPQPGSETDELPCLRRCPGTASSSPSLRLPLAAPAGKVEMWLAELRLKPSTEGGNGAKLITEPPAPLLGSPGSALSGSFSREEELAPPAGPTVLLADDGARRGLLLCGLLLGQLWLGRLRLADISEWPRHPGGPPPSMTVRAMQCPTALASHSCSLSSFTGVSGKMFLHMESCFGIWCEPQHPVHPKSLYTTAPSALQTPRLQPCTSSSSSCLTHIYNTYTLTHTIHSHTQSRHTDMYSHTSTGTHIPTHARIHTKNTHRHTFTHIDVTYTSTCAHVHTLLHMHTHRHALTSICIHVHTYAHLQMCTHTKYTHRHTRTHSHTQHTHRVHSRAHSQPHSQYRHTHAHRYTFLHMHTHTRNAFIQYTHTQRGTHTSIFTHTSTHTCTHTSTRTHHSDTLAHMCTHT